MKNTISIAVVMAIALGFANEAMLASNKMGEAKELLTDSNGNRASVVAPSRHAALDVAWAIETGENYSLSGDITYSTASNINLKLDVYKPKNTTSTPRPALMFIHGGGWMLGTKQKGVLTSLPFMQLGWVVINVDYRSSDVALAPAAVEDCLCALRWVGRNAKEYNIDTRRLVIMGTSAGGHLALTTGMIPLGTSGLGAPCAFADMYDEKYARYPQVTIKPAAIINWFGITDVADIAEGVNQQGYAVKWLGNQPDRDALAKSVSPLSYVRTGLPPIISVHGMKDPIVPYDHAVRLHAALTAARVPNKLISIPEAGHGNFGSDAMREVYPQLFEFLESAGLRVQFEE